MKNLNELAWVRPAVMADAEKIVAATVAEDLQNFAYFRDEPPTLARQQEYLNQQINSHQDFLYVIEVQGSIVGTCGLHEINRSGRNARAGVMLLSQHFCRRGFGSTALRWLLVVAFEVKGLHKVYLNVIRGNRQAVDLYRRLGFEFECNLSNHYRLGDKYVDMTMLSIFEPDWRLYYRNQSLG